MLKLQYPLCLDSYNHTMLEITCTTLTVTAALHHVGTNHSVDGVRGGRVRASLWDVPTMILATSDPTLQRPRWEHSLAKMP